MNLQDAQAAVREFQLRFDLDKPRSTPTNPSELSQSTNDLREELVTEEAGEFSEAVEDGDLVKIADSIADSIYVLLGAANAYGIDIDPIFKEVHQTNMAKLNGYRREDGKWMKPKDWEPPRIDFLLREQGWKGPSGSGRALK